MCLSSFLGDRDLAKLSFEHCKIPSVLAHFIWVAVVWWGISMVGRAPWMNYSELQLLYPWNWKRQWGWGRRKLMRWENKQRLKMWGRTIPSSPRTATGKIARLGPKQEESKDCQGLKRDKRSNTNRKYWAAASLHCCVNTFGKPSYTNPCSLGWIMPLLSVCSERNYGSLIVYDEASCMQFMLQFLSTKYSFPSGQNTPASKRWGTCIHKLFMGISEMPTYPSWLPLGLRSRKKKRSICIL